jgi:hypothetical protein
MDQRETFVEFSGMAGVRASRRIFARSAEAVSSDDPRDLGCPVQKRMKMKAGSRLRDAFTQP